MTSNKAQNQPSDLLEQAIEQQEWEQIWMQLDSFWINMAESSLDNLPPVTQIIRQMREERDVQLITNLSRHSTL